MEIVERNTGYTTVLNALRDNGSPYPTFTMDTENTYLTVTLPVHPYFLPKVADNDKNALYQTKILEALGDKAMSKNELAQAIGYKGISAKLSQAVETMLANGTLRQVSFGSTVKICRKKQTLPLSTVSTAVDEFYRRFRRKVSSD